MADLDTEIIPKFSSLLDRGLPLPLHGHGGNTRHYLYAGDAADAFDCILHNGVPGEVYNVESGDEVGNLELAHRMLDIFDIPEADHAKWINHTIDRPFNDSRYFVNATKLRSLGWRQKMRFDEGLPTTVAWYRRWGREWWKGTDALFQAPIAHPEIRIEGTMGPGAVRTPLLEVQQDKLFAANAAAGADAHAAAAGKENGGKDESRSASLALPAPAVDAAKKNTRKRARESDGEGKENHDVSAKRQMLGDELSAAEDTVR